MAHLPIQSFGPRSKSTPGQPAASSAARTPPPAPQARPPATHPTASRHHVSVSATALCDTLTALLLCQERHAQRGTLASVAMALPDPFPTPCHGTAIHTRETRSQGCSTHTHVLIRPCVAVRPPHQQVPILQQLAHLLRLHAHHGAAVPVLPHGVLRCSIIITSVQGEAPIGPSLGARQRPETRVPRQVGRPGAAPHALPWQPKGGGHLPSGTAPAGAGGSPGAPWPRSISAASAVRPPTRSGSHPPASMCRCS